MNTVKKRNQGFSLVELLIAMMILSIVMVMVVQFMSTTSGAYQKNKKNLNLQSDSMQIMEQISDTLMQARYIRIQTKDKGIYSISRSYVDSRPRRDITVVKSDNTDDFVPDDYGNYAKLATFTTTDRKAIIDFDNYTILDETSGDRYPLTTDKDYNTNLNNVVSYRKLKDSGSNTFLYVKPEIIYVEYPTKVTVSGTITDKIEHVAYFFTDVVDDTDDSCAIYMMRYQTNPDDGSGGLSYAKSTVASYLGTAITHTRENADATKFTGVTEPDALVKALGVQTSRGGLVTENVKDFYISADTDGNAILFDAVFCNGGYEYNCVDTVICRNSDVLTVRPQKLFKKKGSGEVVPASGGGASGDSGEGSGESTTPGSD